MRYATIFSRSLRGIDALKITIEVHVSPGLPGVTVVGLPEASVRESKDRVRSAIQNSGFEFPAARVTINLAPAELPKDGASLDLPIAIGVLAATGQIAMGDFSRFEFMGELALSGELREVRGALAVAAAVSRVGRTLILPVESASEAALIDAAEVLQASHLKEVAEFLNGTKRLCEPEVQHVLGRPVYPDMKDVLGQQAARRALEVAASGRHSMLLSGPPGVGKTMLASRLPGLLPELSRDESLEVLRVYSASNMKTGFGVRPYRAPHHGASSAALIGGGTRPKPGEVTLAHLGVLFLDELPEFDRKVLEVLRQPLESKTVSISRVNAQAEFPANFQLVAAMNPCPCGYLGDASGRCHCTPDQVSRYRSKLSGPLLDRIDLHLSLARPSPNDRNEGESSALIRARIECAWSLQLQRQGKLNSELEPAELAKHAALGVAERALLARAAQKLDLSLRSEHRIVKVARSIADLAQSKDIQTPHLAEALGYRAS